LLIRPGEARDRLTDGVYITEDPEDITGCLEDALHKVIKAEPIERRLRRGSLQQHGLEDYAQWVERLKVAEQVSSDEADILLQARKATMKVVRVDDFTPEQLLNTASGSGSTIPVDVAGGVKSPAKKKPARKAVTKKRAVNKKAGAKEAPSPQ
jgi:acyl-CoA dehydrogenase